MQRPPEGERPLTDAETSVFGRCKPAPVIFTVFDIAWLVFCAYSAWWYETTPRAPRGKVSGGIDPVLYIICVAWPILLTLAQLTYARRRGLVLMRVLPIARLLLWITCVHFLSRLWIVPWWR